MKNSIVGLFTLIIVSTIVYVASNGSAYHGGHQAKGIGSFDNVEQQKQKIEQPKAKDDRQIEQEKLKALRDKAGNVGAFKVSEKYKSRCASCHGVNGAGIMGPKLVGLSEDKVFQSLVDFKSGRLENTVMRGLLLNMNEDDFRQLAKEISLFSQKLKELESK